MTLQEFLPSLTAELCQLLIARGEAALADQLENAEVVRCSYDPDCGAGCIQLASAQPLNVVERNIIGVRHGRSVAVSHPYQAIIDTDNFNRVIGIELLNARGIADKLSTHGVA